MTFYFERGYIRQTSLWITNSVKYNAKELLRWNWKICEFQYWHL